MTILTEFSQQFLRIFIKASTSSFVLTSKFAISGVSAVAWGSAVCLTGGFLAQPAEHDAMQMSEERRRATILSV